MGRGILTVGEFASFEDIDAMLGQDDASSFAPVTYDQLNVPSMPSSEPSTFAPVTYNQLNVPGTPSGPSTFHPVTYDQLYAPTAPAAPAAPPVDLTKVATSLVTSTSQILAAKQALKPIPGTRALVMPARQPAPAGQAGKTIAAASGMSGTTIALLIGGGVVVLGLLVILLTSE